MKYKIFLLSFLLVGIYIFFSTKIYLNFFSPLILVSAAICKFYPAHSGCDNNPPWGPFLDNPDAIFTIIKIDNTFVLHYKYLNREGYYPIKTSKLDLEPFMDKSIKIDGHFVNLDSSPLKNQCINKICHPSNVNIETENGGRKYISVDINEIN